MPDRPEEERERSAGGDQPHSDLPPKKRPYDEDYFGTGEEEGVVKERQASEQEGEQAPERKPPAV